MLIKSEKKKQSNRKKPKASVYVLYTGKCFQKDFRKTKTAECLHMKDLAFSHVERTQLGGFWEIEAFLAVVIVTVVSWVS
jgi:hypothetical protein